MMSMLEIELDTEAPQYSGFMVGTIKQEDSTRPEQMSVQLDGTLYLLEFTWNQRSGTWQVSIFTSQEEPIRTGCLAAVNYPLFRNIQDSRLPPGLLWIQDIEGGNQEAGRENLGKAIRIFYLPKADILELAG